MTNKYEPKKNLKKNILQHTPKNKKKKQPVSFNIRFELNDKFQLMSIIFYFVVN